MGTRGLRACCLRSGPAGRQGCHTKWQSLAAFLQAAVPLGKPHSQLQPTASVFRSRFHPSSSTYQHTFALSPPFSFRGAGKIPPGSSKQTMQRITITLQVCIVIAVLYSPCCVQSSLAASISRRKTVSEAAPGLFKQLLDAPDTGRWAIEWRDLFDPSRYAWDSPEVNATTIRVAGKEAASQLPVTSLLTCVNSQYQAKGMTWQAGTLEGRLPNLRALAAWTPQEPAPRDALVSLVTSASVDRLPQLRAQCLSWPGPLSVALFQSVLQQDGPLNLKNKRLLLQDLQAVVEFVAEMRAIPTACKPSVLLTYQVYAEPQALAMYPVNALRNFARLQARTPLIAMLDVDLLPSRSMYTRLSDPILGAQLLQQVKSTKRVYIIPTFELVGDMNTADVADALVRTPGKSTLLHYMQQGSAVPFDYLRWPEGHNLTDFTKWKTASEDYRVKYTFRCEPWLLGSRTDLPWHDVRYVGYGENKIQHVMNVQYEGFKFWVLHDLFTVHRPHKHPKAHGLYYQKRQLRRSGKRKTLTLKKYTHKLITRQVQMLESQKFTARLGSSLTSCIKQLPWWGAPRR